MLVNEKAFDIIFEALRAANAGVDPPGWLSDAILREDPMLTVDQLGFDSISWLEFWISVELQSGQDLTPGDIEKIQRVTEIIEWLRARL